MSDWKCPKHGIYMHAACIDFLREKLEMPGPTYPKPDTKADDYLHSLALAAMAPLPESDIRGFTPTTIIVDFDTQMSEEWDRIWHSVMDNLPPIRNADGTLNEKWRKKDMRIPSEAWIA